MRPQVLLSALVLVTSVLLHGKAGTVPYIDVTASPYNAKADGIADDTAAVQKAIDASGGKQDVYLPAGTYRFDGTLVLREGCTLFGARTKDIRTAGKEKTILVQQNPVKPVIRMQKYSSIRDMHIRTDHRDRIENVAQPTVSVEGFACSMTDILLEDPVIGIASIVKPETHCGKLVATRVHLSGVRKTGIRLLEARGFALVRESTITGTGIGRAVELGSLDGIRFYDCRISRFKRAFHCAMSYPGYPKLITRVWAIIAKCSVSECRTGLGISGKHWIVVNDSSFDLAGWGVEIDGDEAKLSMGGTRITCRDEPVILGKNLHLAVISGCTLKCDSIRPALNIMAGTVTVFDNTISTLGDGMVCTYDRTFKGAAVYGNRINPGRGRRKTAGPSDRLRHD